MRIRHIEFVFEQICSLIQGWNMIDLKLFGENFVTNKKDTNFHVFSATVKNRIMNNGHCILTVIE